jgi:hypothetical protein
MLPLCVDALRLIISAVLMQHIHRRASKRPKIAYLLATHSHKQPLAASLQRCCTLPHITPAHQHPQQQPQLTRIASSCPRFWRMLSGT